MGFGVGSMWELEYVGVTVCGGMWEWEYVGVQVCGSASM